MGGYFPAEVIKEFVAGSVLVGTNLPDKGYWIQGGTDVVTLSGGIATIAFPTPFPNGLIAVLACNGDTGATTQVLNGTRNASASSFDVRAGNIGGGYRVNWIAIGW